MKKMMTVHQKKVLAVQPAVNVIMVTQYLLLMALPIQVAKKHIYIIALQT